MSDFSVTTALTAKDAGFSAVFEKMSHGAEKFREAMEHAFKNGEKQAEKAKEVFGEVFKAISAEKLVEKGVEVLTDLPKLVGEFAEKGALIVKGAEKIGISTDAYQELGFALKANDIPAEALEKSFKKLNVGLAQMHDHQGPLIAGLKRLNPELLQHLQTAKSSEEAFAMAAEAVKAEGDATKRAAIAQAVFGKSGQDLLPLLMEGTEGLNELKTKFKETGAEMNEAALGGAEEMSKSLKHIKASQEAVGNSIMGSLLPKLQPMIDAFADWVDKNKDIIAQDITGVIEGIGHVVQFLADAWNSGLLPAVLAGIAAFEAIKFGMMAFAAASTAIEVINGLWEAYTLFAGGAATAQEALDLAMDANPIGLVVAAVAALIGGFILLASQLGGLPNALMFVGQAFLKFLLAPVNLALDALIGLFKLMANIPGLGDTFKGLANSIQTTKDGVNKTLTGSAGSLDFGGTWDANKSPEKKAEEAKKAQAPNAAKLGGTQVKNETHVTVNGVPGAKVEVKQASETHHAGRGAPAFSGSDTSGEED